ncbi:F-box only protein 21-like [Rhopilema esculentum]|uniref:F-box only protein 21-like n=1 Tax=Rhopilema esculentum TaxID=499914 RepID=UPI0031DC41F7
MINAIIKRSFKKDCLENKDLAKFGEYCDKKDAEDIVQIENVFYGIMNAVRPTELTLKYYTRLIYIYVRQHQLKKRWCEFLLKPEEQQSLLEGAVLVTQWCGQLSTINEEEIRKNMQEIISLVENKVAVVKKRYTNAQPLPGEDDITIEAINEVLFKELGFHGNNRSYYDVNNSFIDKVLKLHTGIPITLSTIYSAVAKRFGIHLEPVNFPTHFLLRYSSAASRY